MAPPADPARRPKGSDHPDAGIALHIFGAVIVGILVALVTGEHWASAGFWATLLAASAGTFLLIFWVRHQWLIPNPQPELMVNDQASLTNAITSSRRSAYAISSNWLGLWRSSTFRYYLHLDTAASLIVYSSSQASPLERLSTDLSDQKAFFDDGLELAHELGEGRARFSKHRMRLLIYPQWVYDSNTNEIMHLIRSHSAARIPCLPLIAEKLQTALDNEEQRQISHVIEALQQTPLDKAPPLSRLHTWRAKRAIKRGKVNSWQPAFPDILLIDATHANGGVWWYSADGHVNHWDSQSQRNRDQALAVFQSICKHASGALWANYAPENLGGVAVAPRPRRLQSETFFARRHYHDWLEWIKANAENEPTARDLSKWFAAEGIAMSEDLDAYITSQGGNPDQIQILDVGCGFGNDLVEILKNHSGWRGVGIDINSSMLNEATRLAKQQQVHYQASFMLEDAATLDSCDEGEFDYAICMTNTLGNLTKNKQRQLMRRLQHVLKPGGHVFFSTYAESATQARLASYEAIDLDVDVQKNRIVAAEGLESEAFSQTGLRRLIDENGLDLVGQIEPLGGIGWKAVAKRSANSLS